MKKISRGCRVCRQNERVEHTVTGISEGEKRETGEERIFEVIMTKFLKLGESHPFTDSGSSKNAY